MRRIPVLVAVLTICLASWGFTETFLVVVRETRNGEIQSFPFPSQEGLMSGLFDLGYISFDTGHYLPTVDWEVMDFEEPLEIARLGLAEYLIAAQIGSQTEILTPPAGETGDSADPPEALLDIETSVRFYLLDVRSASLIDRGDLLLDNRGRQDGEGTYGGFLFGVGERIAREVLRLLERHTLAP